MKIILILTSPIWLSIFLITALIFNKDNKKTENHIWINQIKKNQIK